MKIPASIRVLFEEQEDKNNRLKTDVDRRIGGFQNTRWHYESRVKKITSFALKLETGRITNPGALEDFFACTLVVANAAEIASAEKLIVDNFKLKYRRPNSNNETHKAPDSFPFDDLRLYVTLKENKALPHNDLQDIIFEIQIKTFLQHAWGIATHDLVYKSDGASWSKKRIAFQVKAMLEHAEISIQEAEQLANCSTLAKEDNQTREIRNSIALIGEHWNDNELPVDKVRLADNIVSLLKRLSITQDRLKQILVAGKAARGGAHPINLSPYAVIVQYLLCMEKGKCISFLMRKDERKKILIPIEIDLPDDVDRKELVNAIFV